MDLIGDVGSGGVGATISLTGGVGVRYCAGGIPAVEWTLDASVAVVVRARSLGGRFIGRAVEGIAGTSPGRNRVHGEDNEPNPKGCICGEWAILFCNNA